MKQILLGVIIGVALSVLGFISFMAFSPQLQEKMNNVSELYIDTEDTTDNNSETVVYVDEEGVIPEEHKVSMEYLINNENTLSEQKSLEDFREKSPYDFIVALYAIKNNNPEAWNIYWDTLYDTLPEAPFEKSIYQNKISDAFEQIRNNILNMDEYLPYMLDGAIYFSDETLDAKKDICAQKFLEIEGDFESEEGIDYCISLSYVFEAIRNEDAGYCSQIQFEPENTELIKNCELLFQAN